MYMRLGLLASGEAAELRALGIRLEVFLPRAEGSYGLVGLELLRVILPLGKPTAGPSEWTARMRPVAIATTTPVGPLI
jgi:hypothetical protein